MRAVSFVTRFAAILGILITACQPAPQSGGQSAPVAQTTTPSLVVAVAAILNTLDPQATAGPYNGVKSIVSDTVTWIDDKGSVIPWLAVSWKSVAPTTWEFKLRENVAFSNGEKMDATAVKFSIDRIVDPANKLPLKGRIPLVTGAEIVDPLTVRIITSKPDAILPSRMAAIFIVPPGEVAKLGPEQFGQRPIGTGPFRLTEFASDTRAVFERVPTSWRKSKVDRLTLLSMPEAATRIAALKGGSVQMIYSPPLDQLAGLESDGFRTATATLASIAIYTFDQITEAGPLRDKRVRQALNYAIDRETLLKGAYRGRGRIADGQLVGPVGFGYDPSLKAYPFDPKKAKELLAEAGYANGFTLKAELQATEQANALVVQSNLRDVGVTLEIAVLEQAVWLDRFYGRQKRAAMFSIGSLNYHPAMDADFPLAYFITESPHKVYSNPEYDRLYAASTVELDPQKRLLLLQQMSRILREDAEVLILVELQEVWATSKRVQGFVPRPDSQPAYENIALTN